MSFVNGNDVFCCLPTGYGKSICYFILPNVFDRIRKLPGSSIVICISPLIALMMDQKEKFSKMGIRTDFISEAHHDLVNELSRNVIELHETFPKHIIFCRRFEECSEFYSLFKLRLGDKFMNPPGAPVLLSKFRVVDMYTSCTQETVKENIVKSFCSASSCLRIVISTIAFSMGLDVPDIRQVVHWSPSDDLESYIQETGRAGRDGDLCCATLYHAGKDYRFINDKMREYCKNDSSCRRQLLFSDFEECDVDTCKCRCCDICMPNCKCCLKAISYSFFGLDDNLLH